MALQEEFELQGNWLFRYRSILPVSILCVGTIIYIHTIHTPGELFINIAPYWKYYENACLFVSLTGLFIRIITVGYTPVRTSGRNTRTQVADSLNRTGIYSIVRHPLYLGNFLMWLGVSLLTCNLGFIFISILAYWLYYERIMYAEEQFLRAKFGVAYINWAERTPAILPDFRLFVNSPLSFSWKKVLKKEKNGFFALCLIFMIFDCIRVYLEETSQYNYLLIISGITGGIIYCILKYLKKRTCLLNERGR